MRGTCDSSPVRSGAFVASKNVAPGDRVSFHDPNVLLMVNRVLPSKGRAVNPHLPGCIAVCLGTVFRRLPGNPFSLSPPLTAFAGNVGLLLQLCRPVLGALPPRFSTCECCGPRSPADDSVRPGLCFRIPYDV
jgi:hypothetical protein